MIFIFVESHVLSEPSQAGMAKYFQILDMEREEATPGGGVGGPGGAMAGTNGIDGPGGGGTAP